MLSAETHRGNPEATAAESYGRFLYNYSRYYDPSIGRYISADPIGQAGGVNIYGYVGANPVARFDPDGLNVRYENTTSVGGWHQRVAVDTPGGGFYGQSFGRTGDENDSSIEASSSGEPGPGKPGEGMVYPDTSDPATKVQEELPTTPTQDKKIAEWMKKQLGDTGPYHPFFNSCRDYSNDLFDEIKRKLAHGDFGK